ncbi:hypothetical protein PV08_05327 [Exophiala spinifera]|uniref:Uncharacterized protein n=1 Tax=Exophiala spinifera TaxID=91928 RepID=A0A0D1ZR42_9EURO|nr:uncharacterized protein PV08_05327 [Exophiala spinifera]KIW15282.1 hypothetical protein PV08_05327 [Exophiala spinifera]
MAPQAYFDLEPDFENEIFQSKRFGKLRLVTGEVICVAMAARILFLLKNDHSSSCIPCHILTEFNVEIDIETIRAVVEKDFEVFAQDLSAGEYVVPTVPSIVGRGYHRGHILPAGIAYECINLREYGIRFVRRYAKIQWGLTIPDTVLDELIEQWETSLTIAGGEEPPNARPQHEGRRINRLALWPYPALERRHQLFEHPPPQYEPRPVYRNNSGQEVLLRHPREVPDNHPLGSQALTVPAYTAGEAPPTYSDIQLPLPASSHEEPHLLNPQAESTHQSLPSNRSLETGLAKARHSLEAEFVTYSKSDIVNYLFSNMPATHLDSELGILTFQQVSRAFRRFLTLSMLARSRPLREIDLWPQECLGNPPVLSEQGHRMAKLVRDVITELKVSACASSRRILTGTPIIENREGLTVLLRHMQRGRGAQELGDFVSSRHLWRAVLEELHESDNLHVKMVMKRTLMNPQGVTLEGLLEEIKQARLNDKSFQVTLQSSIATPRLLVMVAGADASPALSIGELEGDTHSEVVGRRLNSYVNLLLGAKIVLQATVGAMTDDMFIAARCQLERLISGGATAVGIDEESFQQLQEALERVHALRDAKEASRINPEYWAAVMTNSCLALFGRFSSSRAWIMMPTSDEPPRQLAFVYIPKPLFPYTIQASTNHRSTIRDAQRLALRWMHTFESDLEETISHFHGSYDVFLVQWEFFQGNSDPNPYAVSEFEELDKGYRHALGKLHDVICRIETASLIANAESKASFITELNTHQKLRYAFEERLATCWRLSFTKLADLDRAEAAFHKYCTELVRVAHWYLRGKQTPIDPANHKALAAEVDQMLTTLEAAQVYSECDAAEAQASGGMGQSDSVASSSDAESSPDSSISLANSQAVSPADGDEKMVPQVSGAATQQDEEVLIHGRAVFATESTADEEEPVLRQREVCPSNPNSGSGQDPLSGIIAVRLQQENLRPWQTTKMPWIGLERDNVRWVLPNFCLDREAAHDDYHACSKLKVVTENRDYRFPEGKENIPTRPGDVVPVDRP